MHGHRRSRRRWRQRGVRLDTVTLGGVTWDLYVTTATWGPEPWQYLAYFPHTVVPSPATLDLRQFLDHLKARGSITGHEWLASEVVKKSGVSERTVQTAPI